MKLKLLTALTATAAMMIAATGANATTYLGQGEFDGASYEMFVMTDGTMGALNQSNITNWKVTVSDSHGSLVMTPSNSGLGFYHDIFTGGDVDGFDNGHLTATPTALSFDFAGAFADGSGLLWIGTSYFPEPAGEVGHSAVLCIQGAGCIDDTSGPGFGLSGDAVNYELIPASGNQVIATVYGPGTVPEPATWAMMMMGVFGLGAVLRRRRAQSAASHAA